MATAVRERGWQAIVCLRETGWLANRESELEIDQGRPIIALIEVAPQIYHYVVIVGTTDQDVVLHNPARAPFRVLPWAEFDRCVGCHTARWMMLVLPPSGHAVLAGPGVVAPARHRLT